MVENKEIVKPPLISIFAPANRPELWTHFYEHASKNDTSLEIVFVGNVKPKFDLPDNFHFIYSEVKPSQCAYIAAMNCKGEYVANTADDLTYSDNCFDILLEKCKKDEKNIITPQLCHFDGTKLPHGFWGGDEGPTLPITSFCSKKLWHNLKGIDNRFVALYWDVDMAMSAYSKDGKVVICDKATCFERNARGLKGRLCCVPGDKNKFYSLWHETGNPETGNFLSERKDEIREFVWNNSILKISQGSTNSRWA